MMWKLVSCALCFFVSAQLSLFSSWATADELNSEIKIEVLFKPEECTQKSKRGDLMNVHYDGFLAKDGSQFYCSRSDKAGHPQWLVLGIGQVIKGLGYWDDGYVSWRETKNNCSFWPGIWRKWQRSSAAQCYSDL
uniref:peptidylprolyl isomerase n=1 Tax=Lates calcarifer TaxID=8187 RepID=A0A4W6BJK2_LATCA